MTLRAVLVQKNLSHYREPLFLALDRGHDTAWTFVADPSPREGGPTTFSAAHLRDFRPVVNVRLGPLVWQRGLLRAVRASQADVLMLSGDAQNLSAWRALLWGRRRGLPVVLWTQGFTKPPRGLARVVKGVFFRAASSLCVYDQAGADAVAQVGVRREVVHVVGNSLAASAAGTGPRSSHQGLALVCVARLTRRRRLDLLLRAAAQLGGPVHVVLAGSGPEREPLARLAEQLGVSLELPGEVLDPDALRCLYAGADATVLPGHAGLTVVQSLQHGVPVVVADAVVGQAPEGALVREGRTGAVFRTGDVVSLVEAIERVRAGRQAGLLDEDACREAVRDYLPERHAERLLAAVRSTLARSAG